MCRSGFLFLIFFFTNCTEPDYNIYNIGTKDKRMIIAPSGEVLFSYKLSEERGNKYINEKGTSKTILYSDEKFQYSELIIKHLYENGDYFTSIDFSDTSKIVYHYYIELINGINNETFYFTLKNYTDGYFIKDKIIKKFLQNDQILAFSIITFIDDRYYEFINYVGDSQILKREINSDTYNRISITEFVSAEQIFYKRLHQAKNKGKDMVGVFYDERMDKNINDR